jgi:hypothetical protein
MKLGLKLAVGLLAILVLMVALAVFAARQGESDLMESVGRSTVLLAEEKIKRLDSGIVRRVDELQMLAQEPWVKNAVANANQKTEHLTRGHSGPVGEGKEQGRERDLESLAGL